MGKTNWDLWREQHQLPIDEEKVLTRWKWQTICNMTSDEDCYKGMCPLSGKCDNYEKTKEWLESEVDRNANVRS